MLSFYYCGSQKRKEDFRFFSMCGCNKGKRKTAAVASTTAVAPKLALAKPVAKPTVPPPPPVRSVTQPLNKLLQMKKRK